MRKHILVASVSAVITTALVLVLVKSSTPLASVFGAKNTAKITQELMNDPAFLSALESRATASEASLNSTASKGDKGDQGTKGVEGVGGNDGSIGQDGTVGTQGLAGESAVGLQGPKGDQGTVGAQGPKGDAGQAGSQGAAGPIGQTGATGSAGAQGAQGLTGPQGATGATGVISTSAASLVYDSGNKTIGLSSGYTIPFTASLTNWDNAFTWGDHSQAGYAVLAGRPGGQTLLGGTAANNALKLQSNSASSGNTATSAAIQFNVGNAGSTNALTATNNGNIGVGTTTPGSKLTLAGDMAITTTGSDVLKPFQFIQVTGLADDPKITSFNSQNYSISDWNPAVVGFSNGGGCGTSWSNGGIFGLKYWWDNNVGNWRLNIDASGPNDGCNSVQVMFVRKELSNRSSFGF